MVKGFKRKRVLKMNPERNPMILKQFCMWLRENVYRWGWRSGSAFKTKRRLNREKGML